MQLQDYPPGVVPVPGFLPGTAFFAASAGLYRAAGSTALPAFPVRGWMFVGHNLDAEEAFRRRMERGQAHGDAERPMRTWRNLYRLLSVADIDATNCFFTNAYVGLKAGSSPTGPFAGARSADFRRWCSDFLLEQVRVMQPTVIVTLGVSAARFVGLMFESVRDWDAPRLPPPEVRRVRIGAGESGAVALAHPSGHHASLRNRRFRGLTGIEAEAALLRAAALVNTP